MNAGCMSLSSSNRTKLARVCTPVLEKILFMWTRTVLMLIPSATATWAGDSPSAG